MYNIIVLGDLLINDICTNSFCHKSETPPCGWCAWVLEITFVIEVSVSASKQLEA